MSITSSPPNDAHVMWFHIHLWANAQTLWAQDGLTNPSSNDVVNSEM